MGQNNEHPFNAQAYVEKIRDTHRESGKAMHGAPGLPSKVHEAIHIAALEVATPVAGQIINKQLLLRRFEQMCRRIERAVPNNHRSAILRQLLAEHAINAEAFSSHKLKIPADVLIPITAYNGAIVPELFCEFTIFADNPGIFKRAAVSNPGNPRDFLRRIQNNQLKL